MKAKDLAKLLGVSPATVSLVLNNKPGISKSLRSRLIEKIEELGYKDMLCEACRDGAAPKTAEKNKGCPAIAYLSYLDCEEWNDRYSFFPGVLEGAEMEARDHNCNLIVLHMKCQGNVELPELLRRTGNVVGVIVQAQEITEELRRDMDSIDVPCVFMDIYDPGKEVSCVCVDNRQSMFAIVKYLKSKGHRNIGYVYSGWEEDYQLDRRLAFRNALAVLGLEDRPENYFQAGTGENLYEFQRLANLFSQAERLPTALVAENDRQAMRAINALRQIGLRVPEDVSIMGFDNSALCTMVEPHLTTVRNSRHLMGRECVMLLQNLRRLRAVGVKAPRLKYMLPTEIKERDSVRAIETDDTETAAQA